MKTNTHPLLHRSALVFWGLLSVLSAHAAPMTFTSAPAGASAREPAPNVIISVDDSGSMGWDVGGCPTPLFDGRYGAISDPARPAGSPACGAANLNGNPARITSLRNALLNTFGNTTTGTKGIIPDDNIRLGWQVMWDNGRGVRPAGQQNAQNSLAAGAVNSVKRFSGAHRTNFNNFINSLTAWNGTPSHLMMANVNGYMGIGTGVNSPFASDPGTTGAPYLSCRRTYHVLMTDGAWNSANLAPATTGNSDGTNRAFPDGTVYSTASTQTRVYSDNSGGNTGTLADWAFTNWATDFQPTLTNDVRTITSVGTAEIVNGATTLQPYWNPKNDPSTWQGVTQHAIGFGTAATTWPAANPAWDNVSDSNYAGDYVGLVNGTTTWANIMPATAANGVDNPNRAMDLWHMALNGRGKYYPARTPQALDAAFQDILSNILAQNARPTVSISTNSSRLSSNGFAYVAGYDSVNWNGRLGAYAIDSTTSRPATTPTWEASTLLDTSTFVVSNRVVLSHNGTNGVGFAWSNLNGTQQLAIQGADSVATGTARIEYLKGDRTLEQGQPGGYMRTRASRLGDIVNSNIWYTGKPAAKAFEHVGHKAFRSTNASRTPTLYVGGNDGMLHGFDATNGKELLAYVPRGVYGKLRNQTLTTFTHQYLVDGSPFSGDADLGGALGWRTVLVGTLAAGGKGYFVLDVTNPASFVNPGAAASAVVLTDNTDSVDNDLGHIFAAPVVDELTRSNAEQIVKLNNNKWAVVMGNGYNSTNECAVLWIHYLDGTAPKKINASATACGTNGLSAPRLIDINSDGRIDIAYAGDLKGNVWKFDLTSPSDSNWKPGFSGAPLFVAKDSANNLQPITATPYWMTHPKGGVQLLVGTGVNLTSSQTSATDTQSVYGLWDMSVYSLTGTGHVQGTDQLRITAGRSSLVEQTQTLAAAGGDFYDTSNKGVYYSRTDLANTKRGWYFDFPLPRERVLNNPQLFEGEKVLVSTVLPTVSAVGETCDLSTLKGVGYLNVFNMITGAAPKTPPFGMNFGNRVRFGSGEFAIISDPQQNKEILIPPEAVCTAATCGGSGPPVPVPPTPGGPGCAGLSAGALELCKQGVGGKRGDWREIR